MSKAGTIWPSTSDHPLIWWFAAEIIASHNEEKVPEDTDPRIWCVEQCPRLHEYWMERIRKYEEAVLKQNLK